MTRKPKIADEFFIEAVRDSESIRGTLQKLGLSDTGGGYRSFRDRVKRLAIDTSHFTGQAHLRGKTHAWSIKIPLEEILIENSTYTNIDTLKQRLIKAGLIIYQCIECGLNGVWREKTLSLHLDHINGVYNDHRIQNLRFLCPNCHSQTNTYCGKNKGKYSKAA
jgi:hypothetical protein